jgi:hypothetical protein
VARKIKPGEYVFRTESTSFEKGKERPIEITLFPQYIEVRVVGLKDEKYHVPYGTILRTGMEAEIKHRLRRGVLS